MSIRRVLVLFGTRPEAIKLAPVIQELRKYRREFQVRICATAQHRDMLDQLTAFFRIRPHYDLNLMTRNQSLFDVTSVGLSKLEGVMVEYHPDLILVQGDTTSAFLGALAGYYIGARVAHIEAGLRSHNVRSPFPEEMNRILIGQLADFHFAPTITARQNLLREGRREQICVVGNPGIDALRLCLRIIAASRGRFRERLESLGIRNRFILVTAHRRENLGKPLQNICTALRRIAQECPDLEIVFPVHPNPNVRKTVRDKLYGIKGIHLLPPLLYPELIWILNKSYLVVTDSGGIQEEAPHLGKPVLIIRDNTERIEGVRAGTARLVGTNSDSIFSAVANLASDRKAYDRMARLVNPYGDGRSSKRIVSYLRKHI